MELTASVSALESSALDLKQPSIEVAPNQQQSTVSACGAPGLPIVAM